MSTTFALGVSTGQRQGLALTHRRQVTLLSHCCHTDRRVRRTVTDHPGVERGEKASEADPGLQFLTLSFL